MKKGIIKGLSVALCLVLTVLMLPMADASAAQLYSGNWKDGKWSVQGATVDEAGDVVETSGHATVKTVGTYDLGDSFTWSMDYSIVNNYNCHEVDYTAISVGDLSLRISSSRNFKAGGRNESFTANKPYTTGVKLYWQGKEVAADYSADCFFTAIYVTYKLEYNKGSVVVTRKSADSERAILRVSAASLKKAAGSLPKFNGVYLQITGREASKKTRFKNFTLDKGVSGTDYLNYIRTVGKSSMGDANGNGLFSKMDLLLLQQAVIGDVAASTPVTATADSDKSGKIDSADVLFAYQLLQNVRKYDGPTADKFVALTFDDGPSYDTTTRLLELSDSYNVPFTFFVIGKNIAGNSYNLVQAKAQGCEIGSHSWSHPNFKNLNSEGNETEIKAQIADTNAAIKAVTGKDTKLFRFPLVYSGYPTYEFAKYNIGMTYICGNFVGINSDDTIKSRTDSLNKLFKNNGSIILMHDSSGNYRTVEAVEECLPLMMEQGIEPVTVSQLAQLNGVIMDKSNTLYTDFVK